MNENPKTAAPADDSKNGDPQSAAGSELSQRDRSILDFERNWKRHAKAKEDAVHTEFGLTAARYYQVLNTVIDLPAALVYDPMLVKRLQRVREARTSARTLTPVRNQDPLRQS